MGRACLVFDKLADKGVVLPRVWGRELPFSQYQGAATAATPDFLSAALQGRCEGEDGDGDGATSGDDDSGVGDAQAAVSASKLRFKLRLQDALNARLLLENVAPLNFVPPHPPKTQGHWVGVITGQELSDEQKQVVQDLNSIILIGRSGTGKLIMRTPSTPLPFAQTSVILERVLHREQTFALTEGARELAEEQAGGAARAAADADPDDGAMPAEDAGDGTTTTPVASPALRRQLLVTLSPRLAADTKANLERHIAAWRARQGAAAGEVEGTAEDGAPAEAAVIADEGKGGLAALMDEVEVERMFGALPERLADVADSACPLVLDLRRCMAMLDASLERPFAVAQAERARAAAVRQDGAGQGTLPRLQLRAGGGGKGAAEGGGEGDALGWDGGHGDAGAAARPAAGASARTNNVEVSYERFAESYWPRFSKDLRKGISDPALVWREVQTEIKGSLAAVTCAAGHLPQQQYLALADSRAGEELDRAQRENVYQLYRRYEHDKERRGEYDVGDLAAHLHQQLAGAGGYRGTLFGYIYLDEVQDLTPAQIALFKYLCPWPQDGLVLAGDTAQTITRGVCFRFESLKDLLFQFFLDDFLADTPDLRPPEVTPLLQNFRTHAEIAKLAHYGTLEPLLYFFEYAFDRLEPEHSEKPGPRPLFLQLSGTPLQHLLFGDGAAAGDAGTSGTAAKRAAVGNTGSGGFEVVVLVPSESEKEAAVRQLGGRADQVLVLTVHESKGREFKVVLLYNFLSASDLQSKWRLLYLHMAHVGLLQDSATQPGGSHACPRFDPQAHSLLASELKALYVAVTRAQQDVVVVETRAEVAAPAREMWRAKGLVDVRTEVDGEVLERLQRQMSTDDLRRRANDMFNAGHYEDAAGMFGRLGDEPGRLFSEAQLARQAAKQAEDRGNTPAAQRQHGRAAELFKQCGKYPQAALSYEAASMWGEAGDVYHMHYGDGLRAAECYEKAGRWCDAVHRYAELKRPSNKEQVERAYTALARAAESDSAMFDVGEQLLNRWAHNRDDAGGESSSDVTDGPLSPAAASVAIMRPAPAAADSATSIARRAHELRSRLVSRAALHWKNRAGGQEDMLRVVRLMEGEEAQRRWLLRYNQYDLLLELDVAAGRYLDAARTYERKGDTDRAVELFVRGDQPWEAAELLLRRARASLLWGGTAHDWPPPRGSGAKLLLPLEALFGGGGGQTSSSGGSGSVAAAEVGASECPELRGARLEVEVLSHLTQTAAVRSGGGRGGEGGGGSSDGPKGPLHEWDSHWRGRLAAAADSGPSSRVAAVMSRLCMLRQLSGEALERTEHLLLLLSLPEAQQRQSAGTSKAGGKAAPAPAPAPTAWVSSSGGAGLQAMLDGGPLKLLRLWVLYRRMLESDVLHVLGLQEAASSSARDAVVLGALHTYHAVRPAGQGGRSGGMLQLSCSPDAAWVREARERLSIKVTAAPSGGVSTGPKEMSCADFCTAARHYWRLELEKGSQRCLKVLLDLVAQLEPNYETFRSLGNTTRLEIRNAGGNSSRVGPGGGTLASGMPVMDATQLRAQLLVAAVQEARLLAQVSRNQGGKKAAAVAATRDAGLADVLEKLYGATAGLPLPAMVQVGSIVAARQSAAEELDKYGTALLAAAAGRVDATADEDSIAELYGPRTEHSRLSFEEIARLVLLQPLLAEGWMLRQDMDWQVEWQRSPDSYSAWQLLLETARVADAVRSMVQPSASPPCRGHLVVWLASNGTRALLGFFNGTSLTARPCDWDPWAGMRPLTFLALLERYTILALAVTTGGLNNVLLPTSLVLDHLTQPGVADLMSYTVRHATRVTVVMLSDLQQQLGSVCGVLARMICAPPQHSSRAASTHSGLHQQPAVAASTGAGGINQREQQLQQELQRLQQQSQRLNERQRYLQQEQLKLSAKSGAGGKAQQGLQQRRQRLQQEQQQEQQEQQRLNQQQRQLELLLQKQQQASAGGPDKVQQELGMFLHRAIVLLFTIAVNVRPLPYVPVRQGAGPSQTPHSSSMALADACLRVVRASRETAAAASSSRGRSMPARGRGRAAIGDSLAVALPLLPSTMQSLLSTLRDRSFRGAEGMVPNVMGPEYLRYMSKGGDRVLRLYRRSLPSPSSMAWARGSNNTACDVEAWWEVGLPDGNEGQQQQSPATGASQAACRRVPYFKLPDKLLTVAAEDPVGADQDDNDTATAAATAAAGSGPEAATAASGSEALTSDPADVEITTAEAAADTSIEDATVAAARTGAATAALLDRRYHVRMRILLSRIRQQHLLLSELQRSRMNARAAFHSMARAYPLSKALQDYCSRYLELGCPLEVEVQLLQQQLDGAVARLQERQHRERGNEQKQQQLEQALDVVLNDKDRLAIAAVELSIGGNARHEQLDQQWLEDLVQAQQQLVDEVKQELAQHDLLTEHKE
ncbi:TPR and ankyrin repeat-containing protein 1 [Tetrabaena socialis]|uniref:TPR and ankyrin repeat-containing protein 1 n=1 Tax=Tetrabaena socialis TaxID=47790 RepID=A0A2J8AD41_9CHLO|nr:TPR and ankyrin repeat-containing protein 1 [Tetrabaena socialis]|eukprot:PNH10429.1 TPR and ankyrin repeat-containing protein 1 [Tetrabaena socialis]